MRKFYSKIMAALLASSMVFSVPVISKAATTPTETLTAAASGWTEWTANAPKSKDYPAAADGTVVLYVEGATGNDDIGIEAYDDTNFMTTETQQGGWVYPDGNGTFKAEDKTLKGLRALGEEMHMVKITVKSVKNAADSTKRDMTIDLYDTVDKKTRMAFSASGISMADNYRVRIYSIFGGVNIYAAAPEGVDTTGGGNVQVTTQPPATTGDNAGANQGTEDKKEETTTKKKTMKLSAVKVKKGKKKITGKVSVKKATVKIKVGKKKYKKAKVKGKSFTLKTAKLKKGTKVVIKVTKSGYKSLTKNYKVK